jgi:hypothetical protein
VIRVDELERRVVDWLPRGGRVLLVDGSDELAAAAAAKRCRTARASNGARPGGVVPEGAFDVVVQLRPLNGDAAESARALKRRLVAQGIGVVVAETAAAVAALEAEGLAVVETHPCRPLPIGATLEGGLPHKIRLFLRSWPARVAPLRWAQYRTLRLLDTATRLERLVGYEAPRRLPAIADGARLVVVTPR